jgi:hypothetical protein
VGGVREALQWQPVVCARTSGPYATPTARRIAGYNPLNEPADATQTRLVDFYDRVIAAIRAIDPDHALFLDGNTYATDFSCASRLPRASRAHAAQALRGRAHALDERRVFDP